MQVNVVLVHIGADDKSVVALDPRHGDVITSLVRQFRRDIPGFEGLPQMIGAHIIFLSFLGR